MREALNPLIVALSAAVVLAACDSAEGVSEDVSPSDVSQGAPQDVSQDDVSQDDDASQGDASQNAVAQNVTQAQLHLDAATRNAGTDPLFTTTLRTQWCYSAENTTSPPELSDRTVVPLTQIFDDVWFTGLRTVGQYIIKTSSGFFLIDTLNNATEARTMTVPALQQLGMNTSMPLLGALPTHGHADHYGGAQYLQTTYGIPVYLGSGDQRNKTFVVTPIDSGNLAPQSLDIAGGLQLTLLSTPGHTPGTLSGIVPVHEGGTEYKLAFWGAAGMPSSLTQARQYLDGAERFYNLAKTAGADGTMHTHPFVDGSLIHVDAIASGGRTPNPFILGKSQTLRSLSILRECSAAKVAQLDATAIIPVWRVTTVELVPQSTSNTSFAARLQSAWGPIAGQSITFTFTNTNATCAGVTDVTGTAVCNSPPGGLQSNDSVTASFAGAVGSDSGGEHVNLSSFASAAVGMR